jgi:hypothetical protein
MPTQTNSAAVQSVLNETIARLAAAHGHSLLSLARQAGISYERLVRGRPLMPSELAAVESVLGPLETQRELSQAADRVIRAVFEVRARTGTQRDMELVAQEQVLDDKVVPTAKEPGQCGEEEAD